MESIGEVSEDDAAVLDYLGKTMPSVIMHYFSKSFRSAEERLAKWSHWWKVLPLTPQRTSVDENLKDLIVNLGAPRHSVLVERTVNDLV